MGLVTTMYLSINWFVWVLDYLAIQMIYSRTAEDGSSQWKLHIARFEQGKTLEEVQDRRSESSQILMKEWTYMK